MALAYDYTAVYNSLSEEAAQALASLGIRSADARALSQLSFESIAAQLTQTAGKNLDAPLKGLVTVLAVLILCGMLSAYRAALSSDSADTVQTAASLCLSGAVAVPAMQVIAATGSVITHCANLFLAYVPLTAVMTAASGKPLSSLSYQTSMTAAGEGVSLIASKIVLPLMNLFLGIAVCSGVSPEVRLQGVLSVIVKAAKWALGLSMTVFTAVLALRQTASSALDSVTGRTAKFALSSFVPVVGSALSEAYKSVQSGLGTLKSGLGIFVVLALALTFLPPVFQSAGWSLCLMLGKAVAEAMGIDSCARLLGALETVFSVLLAVLLCAASVLIIAAAAAFTIGGDTA